MENPSENNVQSTEVTSQRAFEWDIRQDPMAQPFIGAPSNAAARKWLGQTGWPERRVLIWGPEATGKSHLLHDWARRRGGQVVLAKDLDPARMGATQFWAIDQLESGYDDEQFLHFLNVGREEGKTLLFASRKPPNRLVCRLADLSSRLNAVTAIEIKPPEDPLRVTLAIQLLAARQLQVAQDVAEWIVHHLPRTNAALISAVDLLDRSSLACKRSLTRAFVASKLQTLLSGTYDDHA